MGKEKNECCRGEDKSPYIAIPASLGGIYLVVVALFLIFAKASANLLVPIAWAFVVLGIAAVFFAFRSTKPAKEKSGKK